MIEDDAYDAEDPAGIEDDAVDNDDPSSTLDEEALFARLKKWFRQDKSHFDNWKSEAAEAYDLFAGDQWSSQDRATLREQMRPVIAFNRIAPVINAVSGTEIGNRQEVRYLPRQQGDALPDEMLTNAAKWFREQCDAEDEESDAFVDVLVCGIGVTESRLDYEVDEEGAPLIDRVDPFEVIWDSASRKRNFEDARRVFRVKRIPIDEAKALAPNADDSELDAKWAMLDDRGDPSETRQEARFYRPTPSDKDGSLNALDDLVTIVECQWWEREPAKAVADPTSGKVQILTNSEHATLVSRLKMLGAQAPRSVPTTKRVYYRCYLGRKLLTEKNEMPSPFGTNFSYKAMTGYRDRNKSHYYGLVRGMKDPQQWANKWLSQTLHILNTSAKASPLVERGVFSDIREAEAHWSRPDKIIEVEPGALAGPNGAKIQPKPVSQIPTGYTELMTFAIQSIRDASGVNLELLGAQQNDQANVLEVQRKKQAMAVLASFFDSLRRYRKSQGRLLLYLIMTYLSDGRMIRITGDVGPQYLPLTKQPGWATYDIIVDDAPSSPQQKELTWGLLAQMMPMIKDSLTPDMWGLILDQSPFPSSFTEKFKQLIQQGQQQNAQNAAEQQQVQKAGAIAKVNKDQTAAELNRSKAAMHLKQAEKHHVDLSMPSIAPVPPNAGPMEAA